MNLLLQLILAHLLGDFLLQPTSWVNAKEHNKIRAYQLYLHVLLHGVLILLLVGSIRFWPWALLLTGLHFLIDLLKIYFQKEQTRRAAFFIDQAAHFACILTVWMCIVHPSFPSFPGTKYLLLLTALFLLTQPVSVAIKIFISRWTPQTDDGKDDSLQSAGKYIGFLERLLVFVFLVYGHWEAVGFLVTAKSVFRFGDLKAAKDRKLTEYVLIGTLSSFGIAIVIALLFLHFSVAG